MNKVIDGKMYNTETAKFLLARYIGDGPSSLYGSKEELYKKKTGEFFFFKDGGPGTIYSVPEIVPAHENDVKEWVGEHFSGDDYVKIFGAVNE